MSGKTELDGRIVLKEMLVALASNGARIVVIERLDGLSRDLMMQENIIADLRKRGFDLISVAEPDLCSNDPSRVLMRQIFGSIAQYDRSMTVAKLRGARERMRVRTGRCEGRKPFGDRLGEQETIQKILEFRKAGQAMDTIANSLNASGIVSRSGGKWFGSAVRNVLLRASTK